MQQRLDTHREAGDEMRCCKAGEREQRLGHPVLLRRTGRDRCFGRAIEAIFDAGAGEHRNDAVRQHIEKIVQRMGAVAQGCGQHLGVHPGQNACGAGKPDDPGRELGCAAVLRRLNHGDLGSGVAKPRGGSEARRLGRVGRPCRPGQDAHRGIEAKALRLGE